MIELTPCEYLSLLSCALLAVWLVARMAWREVKGR